MDIYEGVWKNTSIFLFKYGYVFQIIYRSFIKTPACLFKNTVVFFERGVHLYSEGGKRRVYLHGISSQIHSPIFEKKLILFCLSGVIWKQKDRDYSIYSFRMK